MNINLHPYLCTSTTELEQLSGIAALLRFPVHVDDHDDGDDEEDSGGE